MLLIQKLKRPNKRSGNALKDGEGTKVRGVSIINTTGKTIYIDKWTRKKSARKKK